MARELKNGIILKGIGGFYYVKTAEGVLECKAKGIFRKMGVSPLAGDSVCVEIGETNVVSEIFPRKNSFMRPPVANVSSMFLVVSSVEPVPSYLVADKLCCISADKGITPTIVLTKTDVAVCVEFGEVYSSAGIEVIDCSAGNPAGLARIKEKLADGISIFIGNSGVGKSTLINRLLPGLELKTDSISERLGRGKHTTRWVELYDYAGGYIADTPGFSSVDIEKTERIPKERLAFCYPDIARFANDCKYADCSHTKEAGCAVIEAVARGEVSKIRFDNYVTLYENAKNLKDWQ